MAGGNRGGENREVGSLVYTKHKVFMWGSPVGIISLCSQTFCLLSAAFPIFRNIIFEKRKSATKVAPYRTTLRVIRRLGEGGGGGTEQSHTNITSELNRTKIETKVEKHWNKIRTPSEQHRNKIRIKSEPNQNKNRNKIRNYIGTKLEQSRNNIGTE